MSHFVVLVTGEDYEEALAPFDEALEVEEREEEMDEEDLARMSGHYKTTDTKELARKMNDWNGCTGHARNGSLYYVTHSNQDGHWDWYSLGGRWRGYLKPKRGRTGLAGDLSVLDMLDKEKTGKVRKVSGYDQMLKGHIDVAGMERAAARRAEKRWAEYARVTRGTPRNETWDALRKRYENAEECREAYYSQPRVAAVKRDPKVATRLLGWMGLPDEYLVGHKAYVEAARLEGFCPFAFLHDGVWHERGSMGWFGMSYDERGDWPREFRRLWDGLPDTTVISVVDCHV